MPTPHPQARRKPSTRRRVLVWLATLGLAALGTWASVEAHFWSIRACVSHERTQARLLEVELRLRALEEAQHAQRTGEATK